MFIELKDFKEKTKLYNHVGHDHQLYNETFTHSLKTKRKESIRFNKN